MTYRILTFLFAFISLSFVSDHTLKVKTSAITFKIKNAGMVVNGSFSGSEADIKFNPLKPQEANIKASINTQSINTANGTRDGHLKKAEYFDVIKFPKITLQSVKVEKTGPISFTGIFKLTIKNITKEVSIPFNFIKIPEKTEFKGSFTIDRRDYGVGTSSMTLADNVTISIVVAVTE